MQQNLQRMCIHLPGVQYRSHGLNPWNVNIPLTPSFTMHDGTSVVLFLSGFRVKFLSNGLFDLAASESWAFTVHAKSNARRTTFSMSNNSTRLVLRQGQVSFVRHASALC